MAPVQYALLEVVVRIFAEGTLTSEERVSLASIHSGSVIPRSAREEVFEEFLRITWPDGFDAQALTAEDWARLAMIVRALGLPVQRAAFPAEVYSLAS